MGNQECSVRQAGGHGGKSVVRRTVKVAVTVTLSLVMVFSIWSFFFSFFEARDVAESTLLIGKHALKMLRSDFHLLDSVCRRRASRVLPTRRKGFVMTHVHQWLMLPRWCRTLCLESGCYVNENE